MVLPATSCSTHPQACRLYITYRNRCMKIKQAILGMVLALTSGHALAQSQQVRVAVEEQGNGLYQANVYYRTSNGQRTTGLGVRLHYSSAVVKANGTSDV